ncbi:CRISPR-associated protein Csx16 [Laribacter hongkongensis]|uniref:CRISPR-associated protein Csx16 n=1 Tax=Laribacter hongkongensis TaxID=168471 RepID=UPI001EFE32A2|nr:CRISPR-associated protein Csx16 [Laribacter hongkongensis]MCG9059811.1 CRISPR-associated protein Csx16 [Laribacter hongkongensis]MCG9084152.1 CRISPR-associated protein Csx16 [Laribacter hongkongensis]MCG9086551.1 CRISPR-associated protein Csx16 [Laribacter hongkongensis]
MTTFFVTRHPGARDWAREQGYQPDNTHFVRDLDPSIVQAGDTVIGTLPVQLAAAVCSKGACYRHLVLELSPDLRGVELDAQQMAACQARLQAYRVIESGEQSQGSVSGRWPGHHIQFCVASDQVEPNYLSAAQWRPQAVYILSSNQPRIQQAAQRLARALQAIDLQAEIIPGLPDSDPAALRDYAFKLTQEVRAAAPGPHLMLNATGGKKVMSFALSQAFMACSNASVVYVDTAEDKIQILSPWDQPAEPLLPGLIETASELALRGYDIQHIQSADALWHDRAVDRQHLSNWLAQKSADLAFFIAAINCTAQMAKGRTGPQRLIIGPNKPVEYLNGQQHEALKKMDGHGLIRFDAQAMTVEFVDEDARAYLNGHWLEEYVWLALRKVDCSDCNCGVEVISTENATVKNEIDVALASHNRLLMVECKTANLNGSGTQALYKLDSLQQQLGGSFANTVLVSARKLDPEVDGRARQNRTLVVQQGNIILMRKLAQRWQAGESLASLQQWLDQSLSEAD